MTNWEYIKTLSPEEIAHYFCMCSIPEDDCEPMYVYTAGKFIWEEDLANWLKLEHMSNKTSWGMDRSKLYEE